MGLRPMLALLAASTVATLLGPVASARAATTHTIHVVRAESVNTRISQTDAEIRATIAQGAAYWQRESGGEIASFDVAPSVARIPMSEVSAPCVSDTWQGLADKAQAQLPDVDIGDTSGGHADHVVVVVPAGCGVNAVASLGEGLQSGGWVVVGLRPSHVQELLGHELGHNLGLMHSQGSECAGQATLVDGDCSSAGEYLGYPEIMAGPLDTGTPEVAAAYTNPTLGAIYRTFLGITDPGEIAEVGYADGDPASVDLTLNRRSAASGLRAARVTDPNTGRVYYVEYRSGNGVDAGAKYASNRVVGFAAGSARLRGGIVVSEPLTNGSVGFPDRLRPGYLLNQASRAYGTVAGETFQAPSQGFSVAVAALDEDAAEITIAFNSQAFAATPTVLIGDATVDSTLTASVAGWSPAPELCDYQWQADGVDIAGAVSASFRVTTAQVGSALRVTALCRAYGRRPATAASTSTAPVPQPAIAALTAPTLRSSTGAVVEVGSRLSVVAGWNTDQVQESVTWRADGSPVAASSVQNGVLTVTSDLLGSTITAQVRATKGGWTTVELPVSGNAAPRAVSRIATAGASGVYGRAITLNVAVHATGTAPTGPVTAVGGELALSEAALSTGTTSLRLPATLPPGLHSIALRYSGDSRATAATSLVNVKIAKAPTRTSLVIVRRGTARSAAKVRVSVRSDTTGVDARGTVVLRDGSKVLRKVAVRGPRQYTVTLPRLPSGKHRLRATFAATATHASSGKTKQLTISR